MSLNRVLLALRPLALGLGLLLLGLLSARGANLPDTAPQFRVDAAMHTAAIGQMRADAPRNRVVTLSSDRTVRIWQLPSLRLVRVMRLPQEGFIEGLPIGLAISPDGRTIAVGGYTGITWEKSASIYLYDSVTGQMTRRVGGFADVVSALDWSPDGRFLAVGMSGAKGLKVLATATWTPVAEDAEYKSAINFVHFSAQGWLASSAGDGAVRLYDPAFKLVSRQPVNVSQLLGGIRFSPDGKLLAVGIVDKPLALVLKVPSLDLAALRQVPDAQQKGLCCIAWSRDGSSLYINGDHAGTGATPLYRFGNGGLGPAQVLPVGNQRFANMLPLPDGGLLFATTTPSLTLLSPQGTVLRTVSSVIGDFREGQQKLLLSADAMALSLPMARGGGQPRLFSVSGLDEPPPIETQLLPPRFAAPGFTLEGFVPDVAAGTAIAVNGKPLPVVRADRVGAHAFSHDGRALFVGTSWQLLKVDRDAKALWRQSFSSEVRGVNASADGAFVVVTLADGTARWLRQADGREVLAFFAHNNGHDWILWRPDGFYASSEEGDQFVGWHVNRGLEREPDFYRAVQFERIFYRPDLLRSALDGERGRTASTRGLSELALELEPVAPARLSVQEAQTRLNAKGRVEISFKLAAQARTLPMDQLAVYVNGIPVTPANQRPLAGGERSRFERTLVVESDSAENDIRVEIDQGKSLGLVETYAQYAGALPRKPAPRGRLIVLAIGNNEFVNIPERRKNRIPDLAFAAQDAQAFAAALTRSSQGLFASVQATVLNDFTETKPDKASIHKALARLKDAGPDDTVVLFLASHGFSDKAGNYYFLNRDGNYEDIVGVIRGTNTSGQAESLIGWFDFFEALRSAAGHRVLIVDTCHARRIEGTLDMHSLRKRSAASSFAFMGAAKGDEESQEYEAGKQGLFTYALMQSFTQPEADSNRDGIVSLTEAFAYLAPLVEKLRDRDGGPQTPELIGPSVLMQQPIAAVTRATR